jgi:hypothetical protein
MLGGFSMQDGGKIQYAYFLKNWVFDPENLDFLKRNARSVKVSEYNPDMKGSLFCPQCNVPVFRSPERRNYDRRGRMAHFVHSRRHPSRCELRTLQGEGKRYENEEIARKAIEDGELVIIRGFMREKPRFFGDEQSNKYQDGAIEDQNGGLASVSIGRHLGEEFNLPSVYTTVRGICTSFDKNLDKHFLLPGLETPARLRKILKDINLISDTVDRPGLYYAKITHSANAGSTERNIRLTMLEYHQRRAQKDFSLKMMDLDSREHGIDDDSAGKIVLIFGKIVKSGIGLAFDKPGWGEICVLPEKYHDLIKGLN